MTLICLDYIQANQRHVANSLFIGKGLKHDFMVFPLSVL